MSISNQSSNNQKNDHWQSPAAGYKHEHKILDELLNQSGQVRPHWDYFIRALQKLGPEEIGRRHQEISKLLRENGVTYNVYGDPDGSNRPWQLDPVPLLISNEEWRNIELGLVERAELLNLIFSDIYGSRELVRKGLLPAELLFNHS